MLKAWMEHQFLLCAGGEVSRSLPANYSEEDSCYFFHELCRRMPDVYLKGTSKNTISPCVEAAIAYNLDS